VWLGTSYRRRFLWIAGLVLFSLTGLTLLICDGSLYTMSFEGYLPILNLRALAYVLLAAAVCAAAHLIRRATPDEPALPANALHVCWILLLFILLTVETNDLFRSWMVDAGDQDTMTLGFARYMAMAVVWSLYGLVLVWLTRRIDLPVKLFDLRDQGFELVGGRLLPDGPGKSAQLMYQDAQGTRITVYLRKPDQATEAAFRYEQQGDVGLFYWVEAGAGYALVGALPKEQLLALAQEIYRQHPVAGAPAAAASR